jgi:hypothetical protein
MGVYQDPNAGKSGETGSTWNTEAMANRNLLARSDAGALKNSADLGNSHATEDR